MVRILRDKPDDSSDLMRFGFRERLASGRVVPIISDEALADLVLGGYERLVQGYAAYVQYPMPAGDLPKIAMSHQRQGRLSDGNLKLNYLHYIQNYVYHLARDAGVDRDTLAEVEDQVDTLTASKFANRLGYPRFDGQEDPLLLLANPPFRTILTTSPFTFVEDALRRAGKDPRTELCRWRQDLDSIAPTIDATYRPSAHEPLVYHLLGLDRFPQSLVLTEDDFLEYLGSVNQYRGTSHDRVSALVRQALFDDLLLLGFSLDSWPFRVLDNGLIKPSGRQSNRDLFVALVPVGEDERRYLEQYQVQDDRFQIYWGSIEQYLRNELGTGIDRPSPVGEVLGTSESQPQREEAADKEAIPVQPRVWLYMAEGRDPQQLDLLDSADHITWGANEHTRAGDFVVMYRTTPKTDVAYLFRAQADPQPAPAGSKEIFRRDFVVDLVDKIALARPVTLAEIRAHPRLADWNLARSPQGAMREATDIRARGYWEALRGLLVAWNPSSAAPLAKWEGLSAQDLLAEALDVAVDIADQASRGQIIAALAPRLAQSQLDRALSLARAIEDENSREPAIQAIGHAQAALRVDFAELISERTRDFIGRDWVLAEIDRWLAELNAPRFFVLTGEPGSGKTALAARLTQVRRLAAAYFCLAERPETADPRTFIRTILLQLFDSLPEFGPTLLQGEGPVITVDQKVGRLESGGRVVGIEIGTLDLDGPLPRIQITQSIDSMEAGSSVRSMQVNNVLLPDAPPSELFRRFVVEPLILMGSTFAFPIVILVDGLDEALAWTAGETILDLVVSATDLPPQVRFVVTTRPGSEVMTRFVPQLFTQLELDPQRAENQADIRAYLTRATEAPDLKNALAQANDQPGDFVDRVTTASQGNFQNACQILADIAAGKLSLSDITRREPRAELDPWARIEILQGDLLSQTADAIVHSTSQSLGFGGSIGRQLRQKLGDDFVRQVRSQGAPTLDKALVTNTDMLPARHIIHIATREFGKPITPTTIDRGTVAALNAAAAMEDVQVVAFASMGTTGGLAPSQVAPLVLAEVIGYLERHARPAKILFVLSDPDTYNVYQTAYRELAAKAQPAFVSRLTTSFASALRYAEAIRQTSGQSSPLISAEQVLAGLYLVRGEETEALLKATLEDPAARLGELVGVTNLAALTPAAGDVQPAQLSEAVTAALMAAAAIADRKQEEYIRARHVLGGLLSAPENPAAAWLSQATQQPVAALCRVVDRMPEPGALTAGWIRGALQQETEVLYDIQLGLPAGPVRVGEAFSVVVTRLKAGAGQGQFRSLTIPRPAATGGNLGLKLDPSGLQVTGSHITSLPLDPETGEPPVARFTVRATRPDVAWIRVELRLEPAWREVLEGQVVVAGLAEAAPAAAVRARPVPQPDLCLQVVTQWAPDLSHVTYLYRLDSFRTDLPPGDEIGYRSDPLPAGWLDRARRLLALTLEGSAGATGQDVSLRLASIGYHLGRAALPADLQRVLRQAGGAGRTLLIVCDQDAWLPWGLLHDSSGFLAERFTLGLWPRELDDIRPFEFPLGRLTLASFEPDGVAAPWVDLLHPPTLPQYRPELLEGGMLDLRQAEAARGLHLLSVATRDESDLPDLRTPTAHVSLAQTTSDKLTLRPNRPLVSLSYLSQDRSEPAPLAEAWGRAYIGAGCSAFVGPLWAVSPAVEAAFVSTFYAALWDGANLGQALQAGRRLARLSAPESFDWLAYTLLGDPMARPYLPVKGDGYAVVEPVGRGMVDVLLPAQPARFRVMLQRKPPVWSDDRIVEVAEAFSFEQLQARIVAPNLSVMPGTAVEMYRTPEGEYLGWFTLSAPPGLDLEETLVQVFFVEGKRIVHTLMFSLALRENGTKS